MLALGLINLESFILNPLLLEMNSVTSFSSRASDRSPLVKSPPTPERHIAITIDFLVANYRFPRFDSMRNAP